MVATDHRQESAAMVTQVLPATANDSTAEDALNAQTGLALASQRSP